MNGSLTTSIVSPGVANFEKFRGEHRDNMQIDMTQTFNMNILNNSLTAMKARVGHKTLQGNEKLTDGADLTTMPSTRAIRTLRSESQDAFTILPGAKMPDLSELKPTREEREESLQILLKRPKHKE